MTIINNIKLQNVVIIITLLTTFIGGVSWATRINDNVKNTVEKLESLDIKIEKTKTDLEKQKRDSIEYKGEINTIKEILIRIERKISR